MAFDHRDFPNPDAMERLDNGQRLALAMEQEMQAAVQLPAFVPPPLDAEAAKRVSSKLLDAQGAILAAAHEVPLEGEDELHAWLNALISGINQVGGELAERFGES